MKTWTREERYRVLNNAEEIRDLHERIIRSDYRQQYHIQPVTGLLNDPNGFVFHNGTWHLFYQWCPWGAVSVRFEGPGDVEKRGRLHPSGHGIRQ